MGEIRVAVGEAAITASVHGEGRTAVVLWHGAGGDRRARLLLRIAESLAGSGRRVVLPNFPYSEARRRVPDPPALLEATVRAVAQHVRLEWSPERLVLGGKSMGGRIASQAVAQGLPADALVFLGYPLHPPGRTETLRDKHLPGVACPMLFVQGTRDNFARLDLLEPVIARLGDRATLHLVRDGDHSFGVPKRSGHDPAGVEREVFTVVTSWLDAHGC
jgi:predicted alpha/beta-hydrolase family hydrolase